MLLTIGFSPSFDLNKMLLTVGFMPCPAVCSAKLGESLESVRFPSEVCLAGKSLRGYRSPPRMGLFQPL
jgi:hypothetical protein